MSPETKQVAIRRNIFERHVANCDDCCARTAPDGSQYPPEFCMSGTIMVANYIRAIRVEKESL